MENRCVCCGEIIPEGRMVCPLCQEKPNERLKVGDTIKCATSKEMVDLMMLLAKEGIETDFLYEKDGEHGLWLEIVEVMEDGRKQAALSMVKRTRNMCAVRTKRRISGICQMP